MAVSPIASPATTSVQTAADRATDTALAKAVAKLAADKKAQATADIIRTDQQEVAAATKAAEKAGKAKTSSSSLSITA